MAWLNHPLRRAMVAAALLVLFVVDVCVVALAATTDFTAVEQANTLAFLRGIAAVNPSLAAIWTGTDFCAWLYVSCGTYTGGTFDLNTYGSPAFTGSLVLPELSDDVDGSAVIFVDIRTNGLGSRMTGTLPASWGRLTRLTTLYLNDNALTGTIPAAWSGMSNLYDLQLQNNKLSGSLPAAWSAMTTVGTLYLNNNAFTGTLPALWGTMKSLEYFYLSINQLTGSIPTQWETIRAYTVDLSGNSLCGCVPSGWTYSFFSLRVDAAVSAWTCATAKVCAVKSGNWAGGDDSADTALLSANVLNTLRFLRLVRAAVGGDLQSSWSGVWYCSWSGVTCGSNGAVTVALSTVALASTVQLPELTADVDGSLVDVTSFTLYGKGASVTGTLPASWGRLTKMQSLQLHSNALTGTLPSAWSGMAALKTLRLDNNSLMGSLPAEWGQLTALLELRLSRNMLSGTLPSSWSAMTALESVSLGVNRLNGSLPESWGRMTHLSVLRLSRNLFTGSVPASWGAMPRVRYVSLHHNYFCGCLPPEWRWRGVVVAADAGLQYPYCHQWSECSLESAAPTTEQPATSTEPTTAANTTTVLPLPPPSSSSSVAPLLPPIATSTTTTTTTAVPSDASSRGDDASSRPSSSDVAEDPATSSAASAASSLSSSSSAPDVTVHDSDVPHLSSADAAATRAFLLSLRDAFSALAPVWQGYNYCTWEGVSCSDTGIVDVDLSSRGLVGVLPTVPEVGEEGDIMVGSIILHDNPGITGRIDGSWFLLRHLQVLDVKGCGLSGTLPQPNAL